MNPPGNVEERKTNAVLDEDGEVTHVQHGSAGKDDRRQVRRTRERLPGYVCVCVCVRPAYIVWLSCSAGHHPSISHWGVVSLADSSGGRHTPVIAPV